MLRIATTCLSPFKPVWIRAYAPSAKRCPWHTKRPWTSSTKPAIPLQDENDQTDVQARIGDRPLRPCHQIKNDASGAKGDQVVIDVDFWPGSSTPHNKLFSTFGHGVTDNAKARSSFNWIQKRVSYGFTLIARLIVMTSNRCYKNSKDYQGRQPDGDAVTSSLAFKCLRSKISNPIATKVHLQTKDTGSRFSQPIICCWKFPLSLSAR